MSTTQSLDREDSDEYTLEIAARNGTRESRALLLIHIKDVNDNAPIFSRDSYIVGFQSLCFLNFTRVMLKITFLLQVEISENRGTINSLLCLVATDRDSGKNSEIQYKLVSGNTRLFNVDLLTGTISSKSLNFEDNEEHVLIIQATDFGDQPKSTNITVKVLVMNVNDQPKFESQLNTGNVR